MRENYIPKEQRKTILLLSDDLRMPSGVGVMSKEIVLGTCHKYNWIQVGAGLNHADLGKIIDLSDAIKQDTGVPDPQCIVYPYNGYGDQSIIRHIRSKYKIDAIMHFTDPRFWEWLYRMEHEIRTEIPLLYYHVWDDTPYPRYNENFYRSCDAIFTISKQTHNIVRQVWKKDAPESWQVKYIPHGVDEALWIPNEADTEERKTKLKENMIGKDHASVDFIVLYNNRNIRRKMPGDIILAYDEFLKKLSPADQERCRLVMHTAPVDENGTDLLALAKDLTPRSKIIFSPDRIPPADMKLLYSISDVVINMASNEGFGIGTLEAMMAEKMIIANVTGGLQDQMGFVDEEGNLLDPEIHFTEEWGTNADRRYPTHGEWVVPLWPTNRALVGSPPTPYIFDDRCSYTDAADALKYVFDLSREERARRGKLGREYAQREDVGMTSRLMAKAFIENIDGVFEHWKPRKKFELVKFVSGGTENDQ